MIDILKSSQAPLHYLDGLGAPFMFLEERLMRPVSHETIQVKNLLPKLVFVLEGSLLHRFDSLETYVLRPGSVLIHFENRDHFYFPLPSQRGSHLRVLRLTLPWSFQQKNRRGKTGSPEEDFGSFIGSCLPLHGIVQMPAGAAWGRLLHDLHSALVSRRADRRFRAGALVRTAVLNVIHHFQTSSSPGKSENREKVLQDKIEKFLEDYLQHSLTLADVARATDRSEEHVARFFRKQRGVTVFEELKRLRIERARYLLLCTELSVTRIAAQTGFVTLAHFSRVFREMTGKSPLQFRVAQAEE